MKKLNLKTKNLKPKIQYLISDSRGITLIALVITIIVMLILAAVSITMAVNGGLFGYAQNASTETQKERDLELELGNLEDNLTYDDLIDKYAVLTVTKYGDVSLDGNVSSLDAILIRQWLLTPADEGYEENHVELGKQALLNADVNLDGQVDETDANLIDRSLIPRGPQHVDLPYTGE